MASLLLCGLPKSGKSTLGKRLSEVLSLNFVDVDLLIEKSYFSTSGQNYPCRQIYKHEGIDFFRSLENQLISTLSSSNQVIALGGGSLDQEENVKLIREMGFLIYLKTSEEIIWKRILESGLPAYLESHEPKFAFQQMVRRRIPIYEKEAKMTLETDHLNEQDILTMIRNHVYGH